MPNQLFTPQTTQEFLESMYGPLGVTPSQYGQYAQFIPEIPQELYALTDPSADIYQQFRGEQQQRLSQQLGETYTGLQSSLFQSQREARGMMGRAGLVRGRSLMGELSREASMRGERAASAFGRGLYDIESDIVERVGAERRYVAELEAQRRSDALRVAELAGLFDENNNTSVNTTPMMQQDYQFQYNLQSQLDDLYGGGFQYNPTGGTV